MIDFLIGFIVGAVAVGAYFHYRGAKPSMASPSLDLEAIAENVRGLISNLEERTKTMLIDALNELKAAADAKEAAAVAAARAEAGAPAAASQEATDEQAVRDFTAANFPAP
jgi:NADH:ubiquinone oxidoreductase subunit 4 (subunit M)